ncbi:MAG: Na+/H+ antiporter NhaC family protein [Bacteroidales bacterium]|nr:Na+/H+ antiporter NhaC family protein [Bacteroidales bacterium]
MIQNKGLFALTPLLFFLLLFIVAAAVTGSFDSVPTNFAFFLASVLSIALTRDLSYENRIMEFAHGAGTGKVVFMVMIFLCAGIFASTAEAMGSVNETVNAILLVLPPRFLFLGLYVAACAISMATGSGIGSIVAVGPLAVGLIENAGLNAPICCASVVCGAMFGDNLSFISDTTIIATTTQGCQLKDKFKANLRLALPAFVLSVVIYIILGKDIPDVMAKESVNILKIIPYAVVLILSVCGVDVLVLLLCGSLLSLILGLVTNSFNLFEWMNAASDGIAGMGNLAMIILMASGMLAMIKHNGGIDCIVSFCLKFVHGRKTAEACIAILSFLMTVCTANNTIAIISMAPIAKKISDDYGVDPKRSASLLDTGSCVAQELIPYSTHLLAIAGLAGISAGSMIPHVYYAYFLGIALIVSIIFSKK